MPLVRLVFDAEIRIIRTTARQLLAGNGRERSGSDRNYTKSQDETEKESTWTHAGIAARHASSFMSRSTRWYVPDNTVLPQKFSGMNLRANVRFGRDKEKLPCEEAKEKNVNRRPDTSLGDLVGVTSFASFALSGWVCSICYIEYISIP